MAIEAEVTGNMLDSPTQKQVETANGPKRITQFRMMSDVWRDGEDGPYQDESRSKPVAVTIWNERLGDSVMQLYRKGMRMLVVGDLHLHVYVPSDEDQNAGKNAYYELRCDAAKVALLPNRVERIEMRARQQQAEGSAA
ncbi:MAG: single-stranded DNA-binding protein [Burkholderiaceae bacterium]|nr:single-stranded DNA-binding protein [Burkholderiaceae bacterium]